MEEELVAMRFDYGIEAEINIFKAVLKSESEINREASGELVEMLARYKLQTWKNACAMLDQFWEPL